MTTEAAPPTLDDARRVLREHWGFDDFRPSQVSAVEAVVSGRDALIVMPTGGGKSVCYQVPALLGKGVTVVVSPLISLMKDQVDGLRERGLPATFINSTLSGSEMTARLDEAESGGYRMVYVAPERFDTRTFRAWAERVHVSLLAIDEAHCISQWGHDFRPAYTRLARAREIVGNPPVVALTATATPEVREDIVRQLDLRDPEVRVAGFDRRNLSLHVVPSKNDSERDRRVVSLLREAEGSSIVYAATRKTVDALTALLNGVRIPAVGYHGGLAAPRRKEIQERFMTGEVAVVVATNAFGMGIDKPDVRLVVHYNMPGTLEAYYQEAGRAGRDGDPSECVMLHSYPDRFTHEFFIEQRHPPREVVERVYRGLREHAGPDGMMERPSRDFARTLEGVRGDRQVEAALRLLVSEGVIHAVPPGGADALWVKLIASPERIRDELPEGAERDLLRRVWLTGGKGSYQGVMVPARKLAGRGVEMREVRARLDGLRARGMLDWRAPGADGGFFLPDSRLDPARLPVDWGDRGKRRRAEEEKLRQMQGYAYTEGCRRRFILEYFGERISFDDCGACDNCLGTAEKRERKGAATRGRGAARAAPLAPDDVAAGDRPLFDDLRALRRKLARKQEVPPFMVATDAVLRGIAAARPTDGTALLEIRGVGPDTLRRYGAAILDVVSRHGGDREAAAPLPAPPSVPSSQPPREAPPAPPSAEEAALYADLKVLRRELAEEHDVPPFVVFHDRTLAALSRARPADDDELLTIPGVGPAKLGKYGAALLERIRRFRG